MIQGRRWLPAGDLALHGRAREINAKVEIIDDLTQVAVRSERKNVDPARCSTYNSREFLTLLG